ncbi:hypothetical protein C464_15880 [Halorubrum coriense DSM 10284]|uniref:N-acetyltransferase domain-containing protein n=1 Tax=Halorubrum coriense DSM 10284 TaxID=1227466 RepID=M0EBS4_9EURY|nr:hypothetical protein [Halorubrum coriense]ELZ44327.1 hypothetical protein C464_15880 [Halorubrum coriense DSM 10284]
MRVRDAVEADAAAIGSMTDRPRGVVRNMIHDRSVRVAVTDDGATGAEGAASPSNRNGDGDGGDDHDGDRDGGIDPDDGDGDGGGDTPVDAVAGFVAFDVRDGTVHVTNFEGTATAVERLFEEPVGFAKREGMPVEAIVPTDGVGPDVAEAFGFEAAGSGPRIEGSPTTRYRFDPEGDD